LNLNWTLIFSNAITGAITGSFTAIAVYMAMKMVNHAETISKFKEKKEVKHGKDNDKV